MTTATRDARAASRLWDEVQAIARERGQTVTKTSLAERAKVTRPTLDNWLVKGIQPPADGMERIATALGVEPARLWLRWLDIPLPNDALVRIAEALERAFPAGSDDAYGAIDGLGHDPMPSAPDATRPARSTVARRRARSST